MIAANDKAAGVKCLSYCGSQDIYESHYVDYISYNFGTQLSG